MSTDDFRREFLGQFPPPDPKYVRAVELWTLYHLACDAFDGTAGPPPPERRAASNAYAYAQRRGLAVVASAEGIDAETLNEAKEEGLREADRRQRASGFDPEWFAYVDARRR